MSRTESVNKFCDCVLTVQGIHVKFKTVQDPHHAWNSEKLRKRQQFSHINSKRPSKPTNRNLCRHSLSNRSLHFCDFQNTKTNENKMLLKKREREKKKATETDFKSNNSFRVWSWGAFNFDDKKTLLRTITKKNMALKVKKKIISIWSELPFP